jgi:putative flippase GtrA
MALPAAGLYSRYRHLIPELLKFGVVGGIGAVIDLGGAAVLHGKFHVEGLEAKAISTIIATVLTYLGSRFWTFKHRENQALGRELALFIVLNVIGLLIAEAVIAIVTYGLGLHSQLEYNAASVLGTGLATIFRYIAYRQWVFTAPSAETALAPSAPEPEPFPDYPPWELDTAYAAPVASAAGSAGSSWASPAPALAADAPSWATDEPSWASAEPSWSSAEPSWGPTGSSALSWDSVAPASGSWDATPPSSGSWASIEPLARSWEPSAEPQAVEAPTEAHVWGQPAEAPAPWLESSAIPNGPETSPLLPPPAVTGQELGGPASAPAVQRSAQGRHRRH